jgi:hypothetical protein
MKLDAICRNLTLAAAVGVLTDPNAPQARRNQLRVAFLEAREKWLIDVTLLTELGQRVRSVTLGEQADRVRMMLWELIGLTEPAMLSLAQLDVLAERAAHKAKRAQERAAVDAEQGRSAFALALDKAQERAGRVPVGWASVGG